jgi:ABC-type antimicrobial peptide transport system permease subunit
VTNTGLAEVLRAPTRTVLRTLAIGGALSVTLLFEGFRLGVDRQMSMPAASLPAPLVVVEKGAKHVVGIRSNLAQSARAAVEALPGVRAAHPLVSVPVIFTHGARRTPIQVMAYDSAGAPQLAEGREISGPRQLVLDQRLARLDGIRVGDGVEVLDRKLTVVGLSVNSDIFFSPFAFLTYDELIDLYLESDVPGAMGGAPLLSFLLVEPKQGTDVAAIRSAIERRVEGVDVYRPAELAANDVDLGRQFFGAVLNLLIAIAWLAAVLAIGLTMYAAVIDRRRDFGVMRALGVGAWGLVKEVVIEALTISTLAFPIAIVLAVGAAAIIEAANPTYRLVTLYPPVIVRGAVAALAAALVGALLPIRRLRGLEPDAVFRS